MTSGEFDTGMGLIYSRWGQKNYPDQLKLRIWYHCQALPYKSFEKIILTLIDTSRAAPMPKEFQMLAVHERDRLGLKGKGEPESKPSAQAQCWDCADSGNLFVKHRTLGTTGSLRCHCSVGSRRPQCQGAQWDNSYSRTWIISPAYEKGLGDWRPREGQDAIDMLNALIAKPVEKSLRKGNLVSAKDILNNLTKNPEEGA